MVTILKNLKNGDGLTLKNGRAITYSSGYQVAKEGKETKSAEEAARYVEEYSGTCGIWYADGVYYIDKSLRVNTKREALAIGRANNQISVLRWRDMALLYC